MKREREREIKMVKRERKNKDGEEREKIKMVKRERK